MAGAKVTVEEVRKAQRASGPATVLAIGTATPANCVYQADYPDYYFKITESEHLTDLKEKFKRMRQVDDPQAVHAPHGGDPAGEPGHVRVHGAVAGRAAGHRGGGGAQAGEGRGAEGHQGVGPAALPHHAPALLHHLRRRHAGGRLPAHQAPGPAPLRQPPHDVPAGLLRRRHGAARRQGPRGEQPRRARAGGVLRDHRRHVPRPLRVPPRLARRPGAVRGRRGGGHRRRRPRRPRRAPALPARVGVADHPPRLRGRHRRPPPRGGPHVPPPQGCARPHLQEYRARAGGRLPAARDHRLELHLLGGAPRGPRHPRPGRGQGQAGQGEDARHPPRALRVRKHVQRLRPLHPRRDAQALRRGRPHHHRRGFRLGRALRLRARTHRRDRRPPQRPHRSRRRRMITLFTHTHHRTTPHKHTHLHRSQFYLPWQRQLLLYGHRQVMCTAFVSASYICALIIFPTSS